MRASTNEQDANRAKEAIKQFLKSKGNKASKYYSENVSGTATARPQLDAMIDASREGDCIVIEKMDRLTRLPFEVWEQLKARIKETGARIVVIDQPMTHASLTGGDDEPTNAIQQALTNFMLDLGAAMARDDYETRRHRQAQGIENLKKTGMTKKGEKWKKGGRPRNEKDRAAIRSHLLSGMSQYQVRKLGHNPRLVSEVWKEFTLVEIAEAEAAKAELKASK